MKNQRVLGLVATGRLDAALANQKHLGRVLGPVKSPSMRVASRISNSIRAGEAARGYEAFARSEVILIAVERPEFACVVQEMAESAVDWSGKTVAVMDTFHESSDLDVLAKLGALTASIEAVGGFDGELWITEGNAKACTALRRLFGGMGSIVKEIRHGKKHCYTAGIELAGNCLLPLLLSSMECLRQSGLDTAVALPTVAPVASR